MVRVHPGPPPYALRASGGLWPTRSEVELGVSSEALAKEDVYSVTESIRVHQVMKKIFHSLYLFVTDILETAVLAFALFIIVNVFVAQLHQVYGNSMLPDFHNGEYLLTDKVTYRLRPPERGEVIIFKAPEAPHLDYIKRIIGLPGETLMIKDNQVYVFNGTHPDGLVLKESYLKPGAVTEGKKSISEGVKFVIPPDSYVVFGDNREVSSDSRTWGVITKSEIIGRSLVRLWPPSTFTVIAHARYGE